MQITILSATKETIPTAKGSYDKLEIAYKAEDGLVKGKKIMSFGDGITAFNALKESQAGEVYHITAQKVGDFVQWTKVNRDTSTSGATTPLSPCALTTAKPGSKVTGSNYETPEERAKKQVYIVRQSSITAALNFLNNKAKSTTEVIQIAKEFENYVFDRSASSAATQALIDLENDIPL